jgi:hypothetical protein
MNGPLDCTGTLQLLFSYTGAGEYFYLATVSRKWRDQYQLYLASVAKANVTLHEAAFRSPAR